MFDTFVIVDWSAAGTPKTGRDSIWICAVDRDGSERLIENPRTRHGAKNLLGELLSDATARGERVPVGFAHPFLGPRHHNGHQTGGLAEKRLIDCWMVGAQPCWKLAYTGSVGSQSLTGIPVVRELRHNPRWADRVRIWPFETGLGLPAEVQIVFAEVWPSWWRSEIRH